MSELKMDRTAFWAGKISDQTERNRIFWSEKTLNERLAAAAYLNSIAYGYPLDSPPRLDRTVFSMGKLSERPPKIVNRLLDVQKI
jgi:hypothetical protein